MVFSKPNKVNNSWKLSFNIMVFIGCSDRVRWVKTGQ